jgi:hypothetical protein
MRKLKEMYESGTKLAAHGSHYFLSGKQPELFKVAQDVHAVAGLLKMWLRELKDALLTWELYECFLAAIGVK